MLPYFALALFLTPVSSAPRCEIGWSAYKDELCVKRFDDLLNYEEAKHFCLSQGDETLAASLVMVKNEGIQEFLANYTDEIFDYIWLGAKYDHKTADFLWEDGNKAVYTNWDEGYPMKISEWDACIELRPLKTRMLLNGRAKWVHLSCRKRNIFMCQKALHWSLQDAVGELLKNRKQLAEAQELLADQQHELGNVKHELAKTQEQIHDLQRQIMKQQNSIASINTQLTNVQQQVTSHSTQLSQHKIRVDAVTSQQTSQQTLITTIGNDLTSVTLRVVPVGSVYVEYNGQQSPTTIWAAYTWQDITSTYAGLFFRAYGGSSAGWGSIQGACAPRTTKMSSDWRTSPGHYKNPLTLPANGWSEYGSGGESNNFGSVVHEGLRFYTSGCEVRPINQAIRIWKRTA